MKKTLFLCLLFFILGFLTHALFFPEFLANGIDSFLQKEQTNDATIAAPKTAPADTNAFMTQITYNGEQFSRHNITIEAGSYLTITNTSKENKLMWLYSNNKQLTTPRGYAESEQIRVRMDERGTFAVIDKNNPKEKVIITVK